MIRRVFQIFLFLFFIAASFFYYSCNKDGVIPIYPEHNGITVYDAEPSWSSDGKSIVYISDNNGIGQETIVAIDTTSENKRTLVPYFAESLDWSPDGEWILFERDKKIYKKRVGVDTTTVQLTFSGVSYTPSWSKDGQWIAFSSDIFTPDAGYFICKMRADGSEMKRIITSNSLLSLRMPDWFPDGIYLIVTHFLPGQSFLKLALIDTSGAFIANLTNDLVNDYNPKVSPDGQYITWWKSVNNGTVLTMKIDGTEVTHVTKNGYHPDWAPDSKTIAYTNSTYLDGRIWAVDRKSGIKRKISN